MQDPNDITLGASEELEGASTEQEEQNSGEPAQAVAAEPALPEKWKGKSIHDVIKAHEEAEKRMHEVTSERAALKRDADEKAQRMYELQMALHQQSQARQVQAEPDPLSGIEEEISNDPVTAVKKLASYIKDIPKRSKEEVLRETRAYQAQEVYARKKSENPDFAKREADMGQLAQRYQHLLRPDRVNDPDTIEILDLMSRGQRINEYVATAVKDAEERVRKERDSIKDEKRKAFSESSHSQGDAVEFEPLDSFDKLSPEEQTKELRKLEKKLGKSNRF